MKLNDKIHHKLLKKSREAQLRTLFCRSGWTDFSSNDYLRLSKVSIPSKNTFTNESYSGSRLIAGHHQVFDELEEYAANYFHSEDALYFSSGYDANVGLFSCLLSKGDTYLYDQLSHASIKDGIRLSHANSFSFKHNDVNDLRRKLKKATGDVVVVTEAIFSMDGDMAPLRKITSLKSEFEFSLIVDEAHSTGILGENGNGLVNQLDLREKVFATLHTFGKAIGSHGAIWAGSNLLKQYMINFSRSFIYSTAFHPSFVEGVKSKLENCYRAGEARKKLTQVIELFDEEVINHGLVDLFPQTKTPIKVCLLNDLEKAVAIQNSLFENKIFAKAIFSPTVPKGTERLRICLHADQTHQQIKSLLTEIKKEVYP